MLRAFYFSIALLLCIGLAFLGLWPIAIKPRANEWVSQKVRDLGQAHGLLLRTGEISILGFSEIELTSTRIEDLSTKWSVQAPTIRVEFSYLALLFGKQPIQGLTLKDPLIFVSLAPSSDTGFDFELPDTLRRLEVANAHIHIEDESHRRGLRIYQLNGRVKKRFRTYHIDANSPSVWIQQDKMLVDLNYLALRGLFSERRGVNQLNIQEFEIQAPAGHFMANGFLSFDDKLVFEEGSQVSFNAKVNLREALAPYTKGISFGGAVFAKGNLALEKTSEQWISKGSLGIRELEIDDVNIDLIDASYDFANRTASLTSIEALFGNTIVKADARIDTRDWSVSTNGHAEDLSLYSTLIDIGIKPSFVDLNVNARLRADGTLWPNFQLKGSIAGQANDLLVASRTAKDVDFEHVILRSAYPIEVSTEIDVDINAFRFRNAVINDGLSSGRAHCTLNYDKKIGFTVDVVSDHFDFRSIREQIGDEFYRGTGQVEASVGGPYDEVKIAATATIHDFFFEGIRFGDLNGRIGYKDDLLSLDDISGGHEHASYRGDLGLLFLDDITMDLRVREMSASLPHAFDMLRGTRYQKYVDPLEKHHARGNIAGQLQVLGPIEANKRHKLRGSLALQMPHGVNIDNVEFGSFALLGRADPETLFIDSVKTSIGKGSAHLSGTIDKQTLKSSLNLQTSQLPLSYLRGVLNFPELSGHLDSNIDFTGALNKPKVNGRVQLHDLETASLRLGDQQLELRSNETSSIEIEGLLLSAEAPLKGKIFLDDKFSFSAQVKWPFLALNRYLKDTPPLGALVELGGEVQFNGSLLNPKSIATTATLYPVAVTLLDRRWLSAGELIINYSFDTAHIERFFFKTAQGDQLRISGDFNDSKSNLDVLATMDLEALQLGRDEFETVRGLLNARILLKGNIRDPELYGHVDIHDGFISHALLAGPVEGIHAQFKLDAKSVTLTDLKGHSGRGVIEAKAKGLMKSYRPQEVESHVAFKYFPFQTSRIGSGVASGFLDYRQIPGDLSLSGDVKIRDGYIASDFRPDQFKLQSRPVQITGTPIRLDIRVRSEDAIKIDTDLVSGELEGNLHIIGTHLKPGLQGSAELKAGKANFRNHRYEINKARVDFDDAYRILPRLDIQASSEIRDYLVQVHLQGTPDRPHLRLTSEPYLPESQLLVLLSLGYATQDVKSLATTAQTAGLEALSLYSGLGNNVTRFLNRHGSTRYFQVDELTLSSLFSRSEGVSRPALRVGMNVWSGLRLKLHSALVENDKGKREQRVELEQSLGRQLKWRVGWDSDGLSNYGDAGADLWYRWELD